MLTWKQIHLLEIRENYPEAIEALEARLNENPNDSETVTRLGFNLWNASVEADRFQNELPVDEYRARFLDLLEKYRPSLEIDADFCWAFGLGLSLFWFEFSCADGTTGDALLEKARELDSFYTRMDHREMSERFRNRGIFSSYYGIVD